MRCYYHTGSEAVGICKNCSKGLCQECAVDVGNGLACIGRCEEDVRLLNQLVAKAKGAYQTTGSAYSRYAVVFLLFGLVFLVLGILSLFSKEASVAILFLPTGLIMLLAGAVSYSAGRKIGKSE